MKRFALPLAIVVALSATGAAAFLLRFAWGLHLRAVERSLDPIGPPPSPPGAGDAAHPRVLLFGDSRISMWNPLPAVPGGSVIARGRPGETTPLARLRLGREVEALRPDIVVIQAGVNDLKAIGVFPERAGEITAAVETNLRALLDMLDDGTRQVVLTTVFPIGRLDLLHRVIWTGDVEAAVRGINTRLRTWRGDRLTLLDCDPLLAPGGALEPRYAADTLHLDADGYRALDAALEPILARLASEAGGAAGRLSPAD